MLTSLNASAWPSMATRYTALLEKMRLRDLREALPNLLNGWWRETHRGSIKPVRAVGSNLCFDNRPHVAEEVPGQVKIASADEAAGPQNW